MQQSALISYLLGHQWIIVLVMLWTLPWKGAALWKAARNRSVIWFVVLFILNTLGILEIIYIFFFSRKKTTEAIESGDQSKIERTII
ncbi:MAG: DUF5652 family protein [Candidatus Moranbacteria bacterium]|nr:DUF5652 family protein [Candidatus Moranbacteria bacterium]